MTVFFAERPIYRLARSQERKVFSQSTFVVHLNIFVARKFLRFRCPDETSTLVRFSIPEPNPIIVFLGDNVSPESRMNYSLNVQLSMLIDFQRDILFEVIILQI